MTCAASVPLGLLAAGPCTLVRVYCTYMNLLYEVVLLLSFKNGNVTRACHACVVHTHTRTWMRTHTNENRLKYQSLLYIRACARKVRDHQMVHIYGMYAVYELDTMVV